MKKFRYSMQSLLVIKQKMEDQAKAAYSAARQRLNEEEEKLRLLKEQKEEYLNEKSRVMSEKLNIPQLNRLQSAIEITEDHIKQQEQNVKRAQAMLNAAQDRMVNAMTERKTQEKLRENAFEVFRKEMNAEEQKEIDERTGFTYGTKDTEGM